MHRVNRFGTTSDMIIQEFQEGEATYLVAIDADGLYLTTRERVDTGMVDLNRYGVDRDGFADRLKRQGISPTDMFAANKDKIQTFSVSKQKINPLKASKRGLS